MLRRLALLALMAVGLVFAPQPRASHAAGAGVSIALNWIKNVEFAGIWIAQEHGWWSQAGLTVNTRGYDFNNDPTLLVGTGKYMFGFQDGASLDIARARGVPVKAIWASDQRSPFAFITMPNSHITTVQGFRGKRIGYQAHERYVLDAMLAKVGMTEADVKPVVVQFDPTVLVAGKVDAYLAYLTNEPIELQQKYHVKVNIIKASDYGYDFYNDVLFTTDSMIAQHPDVVRKVVQIIDRGWKYAIQNPDDAAKYVVTTAKLDTQDSLSQQLAEMKALGALATAPNASIGSMTSQRWQNGIKLLLAYKQIPSAFPTSDVFTTQFLPAS
jgi:ABC-type nitrate/sulfonate/bicarbonate transport system substrate-binding protein